MRNPARLAAGVVASAALVLSGCASGGDDTSASDEETAASEDVCESADGDGPAIGLAYDVGGVGDQSFNDSAYAGLSRAVEELDATCAQAAAQAGENDADREERLRTLIDGGYDTIIGVGFVYSVAVYNVAPDFPEVYFGIIDGFNPTESQKDLPNVANIGFAANEGSFLVGAAAALTTESDNVGFIGGTNTPLIQAFEAGFNAGVEEVDPQIEIQSQYLSQDDPVKGFENPAGGETAATGMYENGADVIYHAAGKSGLGLFDAVVQAGEGNWAIGVDSDQYLTADPDQQPYILTSMLKRVDTGVFEFAQGVAEGNPPSGYVTYDLASGGVDYSTSNDALPTEVIEQVDQFKQQIIDDEIEVPSEL
ncbi:MAG: BMP family ABC transporter substrate-binding protein [Nocardioidaceae bacterium]|nr:BMP family ABC transporter substrate-binding protein [Nocardioidaceae bacterium]